MRPCNHSDSHASKWCRDEPPPPTGLGFLLPFGPAAASLSAAPYRCKALTTPVNTQCYNGLHFRPMALSTLAIPRISAAEDITNCGKEHTYSGDDVGDSIGAE